MFQGEEIQKLVELLKERDAYLYHACQLLDFQSYLNVGGIPSRSHLESNRQLYTGFETDEKDRSRQVWDKVFGNLEDFGRTFASGKPAVPNPFGPILFQIKPEALYEATDVAICLRSAGRPGFNRENEALTVYFYLEHPRRRPFISLIPPIDKRHQENHINKSVSFEVSPFKIVASFFTVSKHFFNAHPLLISINCCWQ
jgi:hypothetical protein